MTLENLVEKLNEGIKAIDLIAVRNAIEELIDGEYIDRLQGEYLFQDILNDWCTFPLSSFKGVMASEQTHYS
ncbi:hypothetical protein BUY98_14195 [Staphylococcus gallinarum]|uniref:hypothetical protein n=1 Tax=Staphylococcus gallinarum TaxID=1293 RepID=UPI000E682C5D|nr:hypothetical protein [Staphylococcus gallinarum]RIL27791.1 hypothetical protein BUY98_14195 [Staphylococcus gallinarum]